VVTSFVAAAGSTAVVAAVALGVVASVQLLRSKTSRIRPSLEVPLLASVVAVVTFLAAWVATAWTGALPAGAAGAFAAVGGSPYFLAPLAAEMAVLLAVSFRGLAKEWRTLLLCPPAVVALSAAALVAPAWTLPAVLAASLVLVAQFVFLMLFMYRNKQLHVPVARLMVRLAAAGTLAGFGLLLWVVFHSPVVVGVAALAETFVFLSVGIRPPALEDEDRFSWLMKPFWAFQMLCAIFLAELFLGAALDVVIYGPVYLAQFPFYPYVGVGAWAVPNAFLDALWFVAGTVVSAWFLILMGAEMGSLVVLKIRETREREQKARLGLMIAVYAVAVVYIPSFWTKTPLVSSSLLANIPVIGWGMGIRTGGPFAPTFFGAIILMYVSVGVLTVLFGRRALCSVMCGAAIMYQAATMTEMRSFNRTSRIGKLFLGSNFSTAYSVASGLALVSLFGTSFLPYLHLLPGVEFRNNDFDSAMLPFELYFGALWFIMFVSIPYVGNYNCVTTGFCHWGSFSQLFSKVSFFKLKVKDRTICQTCTTVDCAKACPIGLIDMPQHFRTKGEFRSAKCCGVGDCVGACPYNNMYLSDVRHWLRGRFADPLHPPVDTRLPMATKRAAPARVAAARTGGPAPSSGPTFSR
jgi:ferredoxin-like protein FixX